MQMQRLIFEAKRDFGSPDICIQTSLELNVENSKSYIHGPMDLSNSETFLLRRSNFRLLLTRQLTSEELVFNYMTVLSNTFMSFKCLECLYKISKKITDENNGVGNTKECIHFIESIANRLDIKHIIVDDETYDLAPGLQNIIDSMSGNIPTMKGE